MIQSLSKIRHPFNVSVVCTYCSNTRLWYGALGGPPGNQNSSDTNRFAESIHNERVCTITWSIIRLDGRYHNHHHFHSLQSRAVEYSQVHVPWFAEASCCRNLYCEGPDFNYSQLYNSISCLTGWPNDSGTLLSHVVQSTCEPDRGSRQRGWSYGRRWGLIGNYSIDITI